MYEYIKFKYGDKGGGVLIAGGSVLETWTKLWKQGMNVLMVQMGKGCIKIEVIAS
jgi:hypothetical protein